MNEKLLHDLSFLHALASYEWCAEEDDIVSDIYPELEPGSASFIIVKTKLAKLGLMHHYCDLDPAKRVLLVEAIERRYGEPAREFVLNAHTPPGWLGLLKKWFKKDP